MNLANIFIINLVGLCLSQDVEFFHCPMVPRVPGFTYMNLSALSVAILYNSTEDIETFLNSGCDINDDRAYRTEIKTKCASPVIEQLGIECRTVVTYSGYTPLHLAVVTGNIETVLRLLRVPSIDVDKATNVFSNPLISAVIKGNLEIIEALVEAGADINFKASSDITPLMISSSTGNEEVVRYLISSGAKLDELEVTGKSAAGIAAENEKSEVLKILGDAGVNVNQLQGPEALPLISLAAAVSVSFDAGVEMVQYLISKGADVNQEDRNGITPLSYAANRGNTGVVELLLCTGADIDHLNGVENVTALNAALGGKKSETAQFLIKKGANVNLEGPAFLAVENQDLETLEALTVAGANLNQQSRRVLQFSPIMMAAYKGYVDIVRFLKDQGVDLSLEDTDGDTALDLAIARNHQEVINILREK